MIQDLDSTLTAILNDPAMPAALNPLRTADKSFLTPDKNFGPALANPTINLFLYEVNENRTLRDNEPIVERVGNSFVQRPPPLRVDCCYLVTTWAMQPGQAANVVEEHRLLAQAVLWLSRFAEIPAGYLRGGMVDQIYPPQVWVAQKDTYKNNSEFWFALGIPPRPAFHLIVTVALELLREEAGSLVTTTITEYLQTGQTPPGDVLVQIGGEVRSPARAVAVGSATVTNIAGRTIDVNTPAVFRVGDIITRTGTSRAQIVQIQGNTLALDAALPGVAPGNIVRIANLVPNQLTVRINNAAGLHPGAVAFLTGDDAANPGTLVSERVTVRSVDLLTGAVRLNSGDGRTKTYNLDPAAATAPAFVPVTANATVTLEGLQPQSINTLRLQARTDNAGRYVFDRLQSGRYRLRAEAAGLAPIAPSDIDVPSQTGQYNLQFI